MAKPRKDTHAAPEEQRNFEQDLQDLETIVTALEEGGLSLDAALKQFEAGIHLARCCEKTLTEAEKKIEILTKTAQGAFEAESFEGEDEEEVYSEPSPAKGMLDEEEEDEEESGKELLF